MLPLVELPTEVVKMVLDEGIAPLGTFDSWFLFFLIKLLKKKECLCIAEAEEMYKTKLRAEIAAAAEKDEIERERESISPPR